MCMYDKAFCCAAVLVFKKNIYIYIYVAEAAVQKTTPAVMAVQQIYVYIHIYIFNIAEAAVQELYIQPGAAVQVPAAKLV